MAKDFRGQDLRGRSFKGQDLTGADFSGCDLRGVDFSFANLSDAKFCRAKMGRTRTMTIAVLGLQLLLSVLAGVFAGAGNVYLFTVVEEILNMVAIIWAIKFDNDLIIAVFTYALLFATVTVVAVNRKRLDYVLWFFTLVVAVVVAVVVAEVGARAEVGVRAVIASVVAVIAGALTVVLVGVIAGVGVSARAVTLAIAIAIAVAVVLAGTKAVALAIAINIMLGVYLGWRASKREESQLLILRNLSLKLACLGGTQFAFAILKDVDFSEADLKYARFSNAKIISCCFLHAKNNHLALTNNTPLALRKVRDLIIDGIITDKNFSTLDLRGLDFSNLNLQGFDFSHANLSGANLSHTQMTGAILEGWAIDTETRLDDIECNYYYYLENGEKKRMPPEGEEYKAGEFTRIFQKIANTIDFIAHNEMELAAIKLSVEQVRVESGNDDIRVQAIEEKDGFIVVKVTVPKTEDRGVLYHEVNSLKHEYEAKIQELMTDNYAKVSNIELLKEQLREQRQEFLAAIKPNISIENSTFNNNGTTNFGEINGDVTQHQL